MPDTSATINVSLRECRLVAYRVLWHHGAPVGTIPAIVDAIVAAEAAGRHGLQVLHEDAEVIGATAARPVTYERTGEELVIDAHGKHALAAVPDVADLTAAVRPANVRVVNAVRPELLGVHGGADRILRHGTDIDADLWWALFHLGNLALTPDSAVSRRHTGRSVFDANGRIVGELGEDAQAS